VRNKARGDWDLPPGRGMVRLSVMGCGAWEAAASPASASDVSARKRWPSGGKGEAPGTDGPGCSTCPLFDLHRRQQGLQLRKQDSSPCVAAEGARSAHRSRTPELRPLGHPTITSVTLELEQRISKNLSVGFWLSEISTLIPNVFDGDDQ
jgi:hypothetical protein